jgi:Ca-activated chloride channel family protein
MSGAPLEQVKAAVIGLLRHLGPDDRLAIVAFGGDVEVVLPLDCHDSREAAKRIAEIQVDGITNMSGGWLEGLRLIATSGRERAVRRVITLTDGHANEGVTDPERLAEMIRGGRGRNVTSSFIGFDDGFDEALLATLADAGGGDDYWCDGPDKAADVFLAEFGALSSVVAQNLSVVVTPSAAVTDLGLINDIPVEISEANVITANLGDTYGAEVRSLALRFHLHPGLAEGDVEIASIQVSWAAVGETPALHTVTASAVVRIDRNPDAPDPDADPTVVEEVLVLESAKAQREAADAAETGNYVLAAALFTDSAQKLERSGRNPVQAAQLNRRASMIHEGDWNDRERKRNFSQSRSASRKRQTDHVDETRDETPE